MLCVCIDSTVAIIVFAVIGSILVLVLIGLSMMQCKGTRTPGKRLLKSIKRYIFISVSIQETQQNTFCFIFYKYLTEAFFVVDGSRLTLVSQIQDSAQAADEEDLGTKPSAFLHL